MNREHNGLLDIFSEVNSTFLIVSYCLQIEKVYLSFRNKKSEPMGHKFMSLTLSIAVN